MNRKRLAILLIISMIFSFVQIAESAQAETQQGELTAQSQYSASNITKPLNIKYKDRQGVLYTLNNQDLTKEEVENFLHGIDGLANILPE